jgi:HxlR-like helix-turn-helix
LLDGARGIGHRGPLDVADSSGLFPACAAVRGFSGASRHYRPILASRLKKLVDEFVLVKVPYQQRPLRYEYRLTQKGLDLYPIVMAIVHWGDVYMAGKKGRPLLHTHDLCGKDFDPVMVCSECGEPLMAKQVHVRPGPGAKSPRHLPLGTDPPATRRIAKERAAN